MCGKTAKKKEIGSSGDNKHMTWQFLSQFVEGGDLQLSERLHKCLFKFMQEHDDSPFFCKFGWPWKRVVSGVNPKDIFIVPTVAAPLRRMILNHPSINEKTVLPKKKTRN